MEHSLSAVRDVFLHRRRGQRPSMVFRGFAASLGPYKGFNSLSIRVRMRALSKTSGYFREPTRGQLLRREVESPRPLFFSGIISCLAMIMGRRHAKQGMRRALIARARLPVFQGCYGDSLGQFRQAISDSRAGLKMSYFSLENHVLGQNFSQLCVKHPRKHDLDGKSGMYCFLL